LGNWEIIDTCNFIINKLHEAAKGGNLNVVNLLLKNGVAVRSRNSSNQFPISGAIKYCHDDIVKVLNSYVQNVKTTKDEWYHGTMERAEAKDVLTDYADKYFEEYLKSHQSNDSSDVLDVGDYFIPQG
jgi:ankyrin repeat protein